MNLKSLWLNSGGLPLCAAVCALLLGCGGPADSDPDLAKSSLAAALDTWKQGIGRDALSRREPVIIMGDEDWEKNRRLLDYKLRDNPFDDGTNLHFTVEMMFEGATQPTTITYVVGTSPVITVFRD